MLYYAINLIGFTNNGQTVAPVFSFFSQYAVDRRQWTASTVEVFLVNELFMS